MATHFFIFPAAARVRDPSAQSGSRTYLQRCYVRVENCNRVLVPLFGSHGATVALELEVKILQFPGYEVTARIQGKATRQKDGDYALPVTAGARLVRHPAGTAPPAFIA